YRSVIPPSPRETLLAQISPGAPPPEGRPLQSSLCSGAFCFLQKTPSARSLAPPSPHKILLRKLSRGPAARGAATPKFALLRRFLFFTKNAIRPLPCSSFSPQNFASQTFAGALPPWRAVHGLRSIQKARSF